MFFLYNIFKGIFQPVFLEIYWGVETMPCTLRNYMWDYAGEIFWSWRRKNNFTGVSPHIYTTMFWFHQVQTWSSWTKGLYRPLHRLWWRFISGNECWVLWISPKVWLVLQWWMNLESMYCSDDWILKVWVMHKYKS